ncbi:MAG: NAD(+) diphosphatase [Deltaproteobacteria bacterium]|nr:NAD(+) diphosphatase [Deltaproteobacteria bacterium]
MSARNTFAGPPIDRIHARRRDEPWLAQQLADPATRLLFLWRSRTLVTAGDSARPATFPAAGAEPLLAAAESVTLLGRDGSSSLWVAVDLPDGAPPPEALTRAGEFRDLRELAPSLPAEESALLCQARALAYWHRRHQFCGVCGHPTRSAEAGHLRQCTNEACAEQHFPRTDPAIIVLVTSMGRCLLGRQSGWPPGRFSTVAGFVEPGESVEEAVAREVEEETGVVVGRVSYHSSQPWPFPASVMLGFTAEAREETIRLDDELEEARWFSAHDLRAALKAGTVRLPGPISIAYRLIEHWYDAQGPERLETVGLAPW